MYINEHGMKVFVGQEAIDNFWIGIRRLRENRKLHYKTTFQGLPISIENRKSSIRGGKDPDGKEWETKYKRPYGYIPGTKGPDGDGVDVFVGPNEDAAYAYVIHINDPETKKYDEDKVMLGFDDEDAALHCFRQHYDDPKKFYSGMDIIPMWKFRDKVFIKKETSKKLVASFREARSSRKEIGIPVSVLLNLLKIVAKKLKSKKKNSKTERYEAAFIPAGVFASSSLTRESFRKADPFEEDEYMFGEKGPYGDSLGTDQGIKKSILGHHQDIMTDPEVREGGPGSGPHKNGASDTMSQHAREIPKKVWIEKAGMKYLGSMTHPEGGKLHGFKDPKSGTSLWMRGKDINSEHDVLDHMRNSRKGFGKKKESGESGVKGMKWGVRHARKDAAGSKHPATGKPQPAAKRNLVQPDRTLNQMTGDVAKGNAIAAKLNAKNQSQSPASPQDAHNEALNALKELGWKAAGVIANLTGVGGAFQAVQSILRTPQGKKVALNTDRNGQHSIASPKKSNKTRTSVRESQSFEQRLGSFLREARRGKIYYARSLQRYDTSRESKDLDYLDEAYPDDDTTFPRTRRHSELGMPYFHKKIDKAKEVVITGLHRRKITAGVASEARHALHKGIPVRFLRHGKLRTVASIENIEGGKPGGHYARVIFKKRKKKK